MWRSSKLLLSILWWLIKNKTNTMQKLNRQQTCFIVCFIINLLFGFGRVLLLFCMFFYQSFTWRWDMYKLFTIVWIACLFPWQRCKRPVHDLSKQTKAVVDHRTCPLELLACLKLITDMWLLIKVIECQ